MAGVPRTRTCNFMTSVTGSMYYITWRNRTMSIGEYGSCEDIDGNRMGANPLCLYRVYKYTPTLSGVAYYNGKVTRDFRAYPPGYHVNSPSDPRTVYALPNMADCEGFAWDILAKTTPASPHVSIPTAIGELKDLPSLIRDWGRGLLRDVRKKKFLRRAASGHLTWRWVLKPMIGDVMKMLQFVETANKRFRELKSLRDGRGIRKRCSLLSDATAGSPTRILANSDGAMVYVWRQNKFTLKRWGSVQWKLRPDSNLLEMDDRELMQFTRRLLLGVTSYGTLESAWELLPWSWFIDWFSNAGTLISANNNSVQCQWSKVCVMQTSTSEALIHSTPADIPSYLTWNGEFNWKMVRKDRIPCAPIIPFPSPHIPVFTGRKLSILASLAALRR